MLAFTQVMLKLEQFFPRSRSSPERGGSELERSPHSGEVRLPFAFSSGFSHVAAVHQNAGGPSWSEARTLARCGYVWN
jgi:hypothetical protein